MNIAFNAFQFSNKLFDLTRLKINNYIIIDNFFPVDICEKLRYYALNDTTVHVRYDDYSAREFDCGRINYSLKYFADNFVSPKISFFKKESYLRSWSLVMDNFAKGVGPHDDPNSFFTCNVWVTPDDCILDSVKNGLIVYRKKIDKNFPIQRLMTNQNRLDEKFLSNIGYDIIPYKCNRAVIFKSNTIHKTNNVHMKSGSINRRVSYTFLYGK